MNVTYWGNLNIIEIASPNASKYSPISFGIHDMNDGYPKCKIFNTIGYKKSLISDPMISVMYISSTASALHLLTLSYKYSLRDICEDATGVV